MIHLWREGHHPELPQLLLSCWKHQEPLILCPEHLRDFSFLKTWPENFADTPQLGVFTSGTASGRLRLVLYSRRNVLASLTAVRRVFQTDRIRKIFCYPRPTHTFGLTLGYLQALLFQHELVVPFGRYGAAAHGTWIDAVDNHTLTLGVPTHFYDLLRFVREHHHTPRPSYSCITGGAPVSVSLWHQLKNNLNIEAPSIGYGATECSPGVCHLPPGLRPTEDGEVGRVLDGVRIETGGTEGVRVTGANVAMAIFENGRWTHLPQQVRLGDILHCRPEDGVLVYRGRTAHILNRGGQKYSLEQMEQTLETLAHQVFVCVPVKHGRLGDDLGVVTTRAPVPGLREKAARLLLKKYGLRLNRELYREVAALPLNASGKIDRSACSQLFKNSISSAAQSK